MNQKINFENILFLDIETVPEERDFASLSEEKKELFALKTQYQRKDVHSPSEFYSRAGIWAEFGKIVCISTGFFANFNSINIGIAHFLILMEIGDSQRHKFIGELCFNSNKSTILLITLKDCEYE